MDCLTIRRLGASAATFALLTALSACSSDDPNPSNSSAGQAGEAGDTTDPLGGDGGAAGTGSASGDPGGSGSEAGSGSGGASMGCQGDDCRASLPVPGGSFMMGRSRTGTDWTASFDGIGDDDELPEHSVTVDSFSLDKHEVTVGRFREFVAAYDGSPPAPGAGAHPSIPGTGWDSAWDASLPATQAALIAKVSGAGHQDLDYTSPTWSDAAESAEQEARPIRYVSWYVAQAFCIWDGGRLPTEAEWEYAAAGGEENRLYPWGSATPDDTLVSANYYGGNPVGSKPAGAGRWGHLDLAGSVWEWVFDWHHPDWYSDPASQGENVCNVATPYTSPYNSPNRVTRGGNYKSSAESYYASLRAADREAKGPESPYDGTTGFRCARSP